MINGVAPMIPPLCSPVFGLMVRSFATITSPAVSAATTLGSAVAPWSPIGPGISDRIPKRPHDWPLLEALVGMATPEHSMEPASVQAGEGRFNFTMPEAFVDFAVKYDLKVDGHRLVWAKDDRTPGCFFKDGDQPVGRELLLHRMKQPIETEATR